MDKGDDFVIMDLSEKEDKNDLYRMCYDIGSNLNIKEMFFLYIIYILLSSNIFAKYILEIKNVDEHNNINSLILMKGVYLVMIFMFIHILIKLNVL